MPTTTDPYDREMNGRLAKLFRTQPELAKDYFAKGTHPGHTAPNERAAHERHVAAVAEVQRLLTEVNAEQNPKNRGLGWAPATTRQAVEVEIQKAQENPAFGDGRHRDHAAQVEHVSWLYRRLNES